MKRAPRPRLLKLLAIALALAGAAFGVVASGIVSVKASSGHWALTNWFLHFAMQRSVSTNALGVDMAPLEEPWLVLKGAGHFEGGCRPCHGAPDLAAPVIPHAMTPHPPQLADHVGDWDAEELFYIVKHGVKFTGMPAWPALERDDEVRALVAFLLELPKLDGAAYRQLVHGPAARLEAAAPIAHLMSAEAGPRAAAASCARCHGIHGEGRGSAAFPKLAGQKVGYQLAALEAYARGARHSGIMQPIAAGLRREQMRAVSEYFASSAPEPSAGAARASAAAELEQGRSIATQGIPRQGVPSCQDCHGPGDFPRNPHYPELAGQYEDYLVLQLELFKQNRRGGSPYAHLMRHVATRLNEAQMRQVARYYASLSPGN
jgi:cytochrome c553